MMHTMMDPMFDIPKDRKRLSVGRLCLIIALTMLMLLALAPQIVTVAKSL
jgi:hypothetical protein